MLDKLEEIMLDPEKVAKLDTAMELLMEIELIVTNVRPIEEQDDVKMLPIDFDENEKQAN